LTNEISAGRAKEPARHRRSFVLETTDQGRRWLNTITLSAAVVGLATVIVLIFTSIDARRATVEANRAWLAPRTAFLRRPFTLNDHLAFRIEYDNVGRQPAQDSNMFSRGRPVDANSLVRALSDPKLTESVFGQNPTCSGHTSRKGAEIIWPSSVGGRYSTKDTDDANYPMITQRIIDGSDAVVVEGCFLYETFNDVHKSMFCFWFRQMPPDNILKVTDFAAIWPNWKQG
jgi:hypothetical protein